MKNKEQYSKSNRRVFLKESAAIAGGVLLSFRPDGYLGGSHEQ